MVNENYKFIPSKKYIVFKYIIFPFLFLYCKFIFGFKVTGKENLIKSGAITVGNHIHYLDHIMLFLAFFPKPYYFVTNKINVETPFIRFFVRGLGGIPVPDSKKAMKVFVESLEKLLKEGNTVHFFPEGTIKPYSQLLRKFKDGPFRLAVQNNLPIIPLTFFYQKPTGLFYYFKQKPMIHLLIQNPIDVREDYQLLKKGVHEKMEGLLKQHNKELEESKSNDIIEM